MFKRKTTESEFWCRKTIAREIDFSLLETLEDIRPRSGDVWMALWHRSFDSVEDVQWAHFLSGDSANRSEMTWR